MPARLTFMTSWLRRSAWCSLSFALLWSCAQADSDTPDESSEEAGSSGASGDAGEAGEAGSSGTAGSGGTAGSAGSGTSGSAGSGTSGSAGSGEAGSGGTGGSDAGSGGEGGSSGSGGSGGSSSGGSLDQLKIPPPSAQSCNTEGQVGNDCGSQYLMCRIYDAQYGRCEGCSNCGKVGDACTNNTTCPITAQCYAGVCRELCVLSQMSCKGSGVCTPVGNDTAGVCL